MRLRENWSDFVARGRELNRPVPSTNAHEASDLDIRGDGQFGTGRGEPGVGT
jgi:hypothetical protein